MQKKTIIILISFIALIAITSFVIFKSRSNSSTNEFNSVSILNEPNDVEAAKMIKENVVRITNKIDNHEIVGTGFFIKEGYLITNSHIVDIEGKIEIEYYDGTKDEAQIISNDIYYDVALLKVENIKSKYLIFKNNGNYDIASDVLTVGYAYNFKGEASTMKGILSANRKNDNITYLQSDISINKGCSGGPLFNSIGEVIGINTLSDEKTSLGISISSQSLESIITTLIENKSITYLKNKRPTNALSNVLVEVGYTTEDVFDENKIISNIKEENDEDVPQILSINALINYTCPTSYNKMNNKCVKTKEYQANKNIEKCNDGYEMVNESNTNVCKKTTTINAESYYECFTGILNGDKCTTTVVDICGFSSSDRYGSCPKGKTCHEFSLRDIDVGIDVECPIGSTKISSGNYIFSSDEKVPSNIKTFNNVYYSLYTKRNDSDGLIYYFDTRIPTYHCAKKYDNDLSAYIVYTYDELKETACSYGELKNGYLSTTPSGFYCKQTLSTHWYVYDVVCSNPEYTYAIEDGHGQCRKKTTTNINANLRYKCNNDFTLNGTTCSKSETYIPKTTYTCNGSDTLNANTCTEIVEQTDMKKEYGCPNNYTLNENKCILNN